MRMQRTRTKQLRANNNARASEKYAVQFQVQLMFVQLLIGL